MVQTVLCENPKEPIPGLSIPAILKSTLVSPPEALWGPMRGPKGSHESGQLWQDHPHGAPGQGAKRMAQALNQVSPNSASKRLSKTASL